MKNILTVCVYVSLFLFNSAFANNQPQPNKCPSVMSIAATGVNDVKKMPFGQNRWLGLADASNYDTNVQWYFAIMNVAAPSKSEAIINASKAISMLVSMDAPEENDEGGFICTYRGNYAGDTVSGIAINVYGEFSDFAFKDIMPIVA